MKFRVVESGTYWKEYEVDAIDQDDAEHQVRFGEGILVREGQEVELFEVEPTSK